MITENIHNTTTSLDSLLIEAVTNYTIARSNVENASNKSAFEAARIEEAKWMSYCLAWIARARAFELIIEGESLTSKLDKTKQENEQMRTENISLRQLNDRLVKENRELHKFVDERLGGKSVGDLKP